MKQAFLVLLGVRPAHGYEQKTELERSFAGLLPALNDGQVYTTLARLERDDLVPSRDAGADGRARRVLAHRARPPRRP